MGTLTSKNISIEVDSAVFNDIYLPYLEEMARIQIFYGGSGSGKSVFLAQRTVYDLIKGGRNYLIARKVGRTIRGSVFAEIQRVIADWGVAQLFDVNKSDMLITCQNGYQIVFVGLDDPEKLKSIVPKKGALTDVWIEEATECSLDDVKQLLKRQRGGDPNIRKRLSLSFNPILQVHWIYQTYFKNINLTDKQTEYKTDNLTILRTWYIHNRFLTPDDTKDLEKETDPYYYSVYTIGMWGVLGNVIFTNWRVEDLSGMLNQFTNHRNGLDFGYSDNPAAMPITHYDEPKKIIYIFDELYEKGLTNDVLAQKIIELIGKDVVRCDSAEPKSIAELQHYGVNAVAADKGKDSVLFGIQWLQQQTIILDTKCVNMKNEFSQYHWKEDAMGNKLPVPVDKHNHGIDGLRYGYEKDMTGFWSMVSVEYAGGEKQVRRVPMVILVGRNQKECPFCGTNHDITTTYCEVCGSRI